jgi:hypothetical protein
MAGDGVLSLWKKKHEPDWYFHYAESARQTLEV